MILGFLSQWKKLLKPLELEALKMEDIIMKLQDGLKAWCSKISEHNVEVPHFGSLGVIYLGFLSEVVKLLRCSVVVKPQMSQSPNEKDPAFCFCFSFAVFFFLFEVVLCFRGEVEGAEQKL
jgi:hypothetical protein